MTLAASRGPSWPGVKRLCRPHPTRRRSFEARPLSVTVAPPVLAIFFSFPSAKNPIHCPSGEKNGYSAPSVPVSGVAWSWLSRCTGAGDCHRGPVARQTPPQRHRAIRIAAAPEFAVETPAASSTLSCSGMSRGVSCRGAHSTRMRATASAPSTSHGTRVGQAAEHARAWHSRILPAHPRASLRSRGARRRSSCNRRVESFSQAAAQHPSKIRRRRRGQRSPVRFAFEDRRDRDRRPSCPRNAVRPVSISYSTQPNAQMSVRLSTVCPRACSGLMYAGRAQDDALARAARTSPSATASRSSASPSLGDGLGQPEVEHLHDAVGRDLDVRRLQVPVDDPLVVRGLERLRDLPRDRECFRRAGSDRCASRSASVGPSTSSRIERGGRRPTPRSRRSRRCADGSATPSIRASRSKRASRSGSLREDARQNLDRHVAAELCVACAVDLAHPAGADPRRDLVTRLCAGLPGASSPCVSARSTASISRKLFACVSSASSASTSWCNASSPPHSSARYSSLRFVGYARASSYTSFSRFQSSRERHVPWYSTACWWRDHPPSGFLVWRPMIVAPSLATARASMVRPEPCAVAEGVGDEREDQAVSAGRLGGGCPCHSSRWRELRVRKKTPCIG